VRAFVHDIKYSLLTVFIVCFILLNNRCSYCNCFSCLYLLWLFVFTVFVNCICSVSVLLKVFILSVVLCLYCMLSYCSKRVICLLSYFCTIATG
jgi:hypothetical protein